MDEKKWYVVYTKPQWEKKVSQQLEKLYQIESWCPTTKSRRQWSDRVKILEMPLFRCYVFVRVTEQERVEALRLEGVFNYVCYLGKPAVIKDAEIAELKEFLQDYTEVKVQQLTPGSNVMIKTGIFEGQKGVVRRVISNDRVVLEMPQLGCQLEASVDTL